MTFDQNSFLSVAFLGQSDVTVLGLSGEIVARIPSCGMLPTNVGFALPGKGRSHVTEYQHGQMKVFSLRSDRPSLWDGRTRSTKEGAY
jgi:hypothetical protein